MLRWADQTGKPLHRQHLSTRLLYDPQRADLAQLKQAHRSRKRTSTHSRIPRFFWPSQPRTPHPRMGPAPRRPGRPHPRAAAHRQVNTPFWSQTSLPPRGGVGDISISPVCRPSPARPSAAQPSTTRLSTAHPNTRSHNQASAQPRSQMPSNSRPAP